MNTQREGLEFRLSSEDDPSIESVRRLRMRIALFTMRPEDMEWFDENCPEWLEHVSVHRLDQVSMFTRKEVEETAGDVVAIMQERMALEISRKIMERIPSAVDVPEPEE